MHAPYRRLPLTALSLLTAWLLGALMASHAPAGLDLTAGPATRPSPLLIHLPGIGGELTPDRLFVAGLEQSKLGATIQIYDWTGEHSGMTSLVNPRIHESEAVKVARLIETNYRAAPSRPIILTAHSGGAGIAAWALARLPDDVHIKTLVLLAPAISPQFDLRPAMRHVNGNVYAFTSMNDVIVLGQGTRLFGTIDRVNVDASGRVGFALPEGATSDEYDKLVQFPYDDAWMNNGNIGDHVGPLMRRFSRDIIGPLLINGNLPTRRVPTSRPTTLQANPPTTVPASKAK